jgi:quercetin dioxygenase-like cupin family protein
MSAFDDVREIAPRRIWDSVVVRSVDGERLTLGVVELDPDSVVPEHRHENEQLGLVLQVSLRFRIGDDSRELGPGGTWSIPPNVPHEVHVGPEGAVVIDVFAPTRADWEAIAQDEPREPHWPRS